MNELIKNDFIVLHRAYKDSANIVANILEDVRGFTNPLINPLAELLNPTPKERGLFIVTIKYVETNE